MAQVITTTFKLKRGLAAAWEKTNPVLAQGEPGFVLDKNLLKIGDGATAWNDLPYLAGAGTDYVIQEADETTPGIMKLYQTMGDNTDGAMSQKAISDELDDKFEIGVDLENELIIFSNDI